MNILYITQNYESVQKHLFESLKKAAPGVRLAHYRMVGSTKREQAAEGVSFFNSRIRVKGFLFFRLKLWRISRKCGKYYQKIPLDILHGNMLFCDGYLCRKLARQKNIPFCVSVRDTDINSKFLWKLPWTKSMGLANLAGASAVIFLSPKYLDKLIAKLPPKYKETVRRKAYIVPNGIDDYYIDNAAFKGPLASDDLRLIFVGKISKRKNLETTAAACRLLIDRGYNTVLNVVGPVADQRYEKLIEDTPFIHYFGKCEKEQVLGHLRASDIFVMPSHTETFGLVYLEAMTQGLPVIYTRGQGFDGQFEEGTVGFSVDDNSPEEIAERVIAIKENYETMSRNATAMASKYSWGEAAGKYMDVYRNVINHTGP